MKCWSIVNVISVVATLTLSLAAHAQVTQENRFEILGTLIADRAASRTVMPLGPNGFELSESGAIDEVGLRKELFTEGRSIETGDVVTITGISFDDDKIEIELNDGGTRNTSILDRITFGTGTTSRRITEVDNRPPPTGSKIVLRFDDKAPLQLNSELLRTYLAPVLDFNEQNFMDSGIESLPEEFQDAVRAEEVIIGMDQSTVLMAKDRPNQRIREQVDGVERETWIYDENGIARDFITFEGGVVVKTVRY